MSQQPKSFVHHTMIYALGVLALRGVSLILLPLHTRYLTPAEYGLLQLLFLIGEVFHIGLLFHGIGIATLNYYKLADEEKGRQHIAASVSLFTVAMFVIGLLITLLMAPAMTRFLHLEGREVWIVCGIFCILMQCTATMPLTLMQARMESSLYVLTTLGISLLRMLFTILFVVIAGWGIWGVLLALALSYSLFGIPLSIREFSRSSFIPDRQHLRRLARFAWPFLPSGVCFFILRSGDQFMLARYVGMEEVGRYALGNQVAILASLLIVQPVVQVWQSWQYQAFKHPQRADLFGQALTRISFLYCYAALGLVCFRDEVVAVLGPPEYESARVVVVPVLAAYYFMAMAEFFGEVLHLRSRTDLKPWISLVSMLVTITLYLAWIPAYGKIGAAYATLVGLGFHAVATYGVAQRVMFIRLELKRLALLFLLTVSCGLCFRQLGFGWQVAPLKVLLLVAWPVMFWMSGLVSNEEKRYLLLLVRRLSLKQTTETL